jgi:hypothetical protein
MLLVIVTIVSLLIATAMAVIAWRVSREERERSAARVAALSAEIDGDRPLDAVPAAWAESAAWPESSRTHDAPPVEAIAAASAGGLFSPRTAERSPLARLGPAVLAGVVLVGGAVATVITFSGSGGTAAATARDPRPLELLSLRHTVKDGGLSVTGLVRNAAQNPELERLMAVVFLFDDKGGFLASARAPLDFTSLSPGEESPFLVTMNAPPGVSRYRVSFRRDEGGVIPHLDRREARMP